MSPVKFIPAGRRGAISKKRRLSARTSLLRASKYWRNDSEWAYIPQGRMRITGIAYLQEGYTSRRTSRRLTCGFSHKASRKLAAGPRGRLLVRLNFKVPESTLEHLPTRGKFILRSIFSEKSTADGTQSGPTPTRRRLTHKVLVKEPTEVPGSEVRVADSTDLPVTVISVAHVVINTGALREMHWHPIGYGPIAMLEIFKSPKFDEFSPDRWLAVASPHLIQAHLNVEKAFTKALDKGHTPIRDGHVHRTWDMQRRTPQGSLLRSSERPRREKILKSTGSHSHNTHATQSRIGSALDPGSTKWEDPEDRFLIHGLAHRPRSDVIVLRDGNRLSPPLDDMAPTPVAIRGADGQTYDDESGADRRSDDDSRRRASVQSSLLLIPDATRFPLEIFEDIIDQMHNDTLPAAAQVCAAWYPRAMRNLYYTVEISTRRRFDMLFKQCRASLRVKQWLATTRELRVTDDTTPNVLSRLVLYGIAKHKTISYEVEATSFVHNTALRSLVLDFYGLDLKAQDQGDAMNIVARRSHDILSTVRSHQLEHIEILPGFHMDHLSAPTLERVDLRALHETMSQPHFNALKDVSVKMCLRVSQACHSTSKAQAEDVRQKFEAMFREVLQPWSDRGIIKHFTRGPI
ncbi:uncharacterized protein B0H18DRAFT_1105134 [Fomitopsis serialis]|uniref:uncharacterized protein n=1 Tax=Fomitopsis serialis TaxID=139415 RepID=UPI002007244D|nr:uncharacterized protein B0H18DRAFT_1105134 [Neoantrodia serialis]KAH9924048.1 hypothetical protein B0H18DRAFT_1105134 [Neoantrodia serialis]